MSLWKFAAGLAVAVFLFASSDLLFSGVPNPTTRQVIDWGTRALLLPQQVARYYDGGGSLDPEELRELERAGLASCGVVLYGQKGALRVTLTDFLNRRPRIAGSLDCTVKGKFGSSVRVAHYLFACLDGWIPEGGSQIGPGVRQYGLMYPIITCSGLGGHNLR